MADWRDRGFVPDSDEEDEEAIIETQVNREGNLNLDDDEFRDIDDVLQGDKATEIENQHPTHDGQVLEWKDNPKSTERSPTPGTNSTAGPLTRGFRPSSTEGAEGQNQNGVNISPHTHDSTCRPKTPDTVRENGIDYYDGTTTAELGAEQSHKGKAGGNSILDVWEEPEHTFLSSSLSSPLSELPSSPITELIRRNDSPSPSSRKTSAMEQGSDMQPRVHSPRARDHDMSQVQQAFAEEIAMSGRPARALRQRNPIQLHPYMLESERYRQFLKARGVKPLRIAQAQAEAESSGVNSEEQDLDADESQSQGHRNLLYADSSPPILIAENRETATNPLPEGSGSPDPQADAEELPDVDFLLRGPLSHGIREGYKRRKTSHTYGRHVETTLRKPTNAVPRGSTIGNICDTVMVVPDNVFDIPPSPPLSGNLSVHEHGPLVTSEFRFPHSRSSIHPVTPLTSSASKQRSVINLPEDSDTESLSSASSSSTTSSLASGPTQSHQLHQVQRKIRGVLPASWLRLDLKTQKKRPETIFERNQRSVSPNRCQLHRGVARKMPVSRKHVPTADHDDINPVFISDESDVYSEEHITDLKHAGERPLPRSEFDGDTLIRPPLGDIEEDNRIDAMLPSKPRQRRVGHPQKRRQTRLTDRGPTTVKRDATHHTHFKHQHFEPCHQPRITEHLSRAKSSTAKLRPAVPRLSVLDAPELRTDLKNATPNFIRVAARQARSRNDGGRHAPTQKFIRLGNRADTADVQSVLRDWREGAITAKPQSPKTSHNRVALKELSGNEQRTANPQASHKQVEPNPPLDINFTLSHTHDIFKPSAGRQAVRKQIIRQRQWAHPVVSRLDRTNVPSHGKVHNAAGPRRLLSSLQNTAGPRLAQLETIESRNRSSNQRAGFEDILSRIDRVSRPSAHYGPTPPSFPLARFLESEDSLPSSLSLPYAQQAFEPGKPHGPNGREPLLAQRSRKRRPRRIDADALEFQQPPIDVKVHERGLSCDSLPENGDKLVLYGLAPFGVPYTTDFNISPLKVDTFFHESTFVGSGDFARSLKIALSRDLDLPAGITVHHIGDRMLRWSAWDENVSSELTSVFDFAGRSLDSVAEQLESNQGQRDGIPTVIEEVVSLLRFIIRYFTQTLSFIDPIDRSLFARKCIGLLKGFTDRLLARYLPMHQDVRSKLSYLHQDVMQIIAYNLVLANQIRQIASDDMVDASLSAEAEDLVKANASYMVSRLHRADFGTLRTFLEENRYHAKREAGIRGDSTTLEALIIMFHILRQSDLPNTSFWNLLYRQKLQVDSEKIHEVQILERTWHDIFTVLPLLEFDESGFIEVGRRFRSCADGWNAVRPLVSAALDSYLASPEKQPATFNSYCRALFDRCLHLINYWGWRKCEVIIGTLFDFFARSNLAHLRYEESRGSPNFLQNLDKCLTPESDPDDRCFHILLKVVGAGLKAMKDVYPEKKIRDIAWRLMPNHGRLHPKDMAVSQEDLDALRNHHDLLCVIYWASPPGFRPKLDVIRNLIDPGNSHREACHVNIRAWSNLIRFQLATDEPATSLEPFALWHEHFTKQMLSQHSLARGEAESQFASAASSGHVIISPELLESTIAKNQRQVEAVLSDALSSMKNALSVTRNVASAKVLLSKASTAEIFALFDVKQPRANAIVLQALDVVLQYAQLCGKGNDSNTIQQPSEDSQEYGDWSAFEDVAEADPKDEAIVQLYNTVHDGLARLLSNCFGADEMVDDGLLVKITDTWICVAELLVSKGLKQWSNYIDSYSAESWNSLRRTEQTAKYTAYFMSKIIEEDRKCYEDNKAVFLQSWVSGLVERNSLLKFQHRLTSALLNADPNDELFANLPFWVTGQERRYSLSFTDFRDRRLSLISSFLSNMRQSLAEARSNDQGGYSRLLQEYRELLKHLMNSMKGNYQNLGYGTPVKGAYVDFVHRVVEFLQQHTSDICQVDRFFTDSSAFPLPTTDPTYVVGRLKSYGLRLAEPRTPKQLVAFIQTVTERAVVDDQQAYLVEQLYTAMSNAFEGGDSNKPTLRSFLVVSVFPEYIASSFNTSTGWLLAKPILQAIQRMYRRILEDLDGTDASSTESFISMTTTLLDTMRQAVGLLVDHSGLLDQPSILNILVDVISTTTAILPSLSYIHRLSNGATHAAQCIDFIKSFAIFVAAHLLGHEDACSPHMDVPELLSLLPPRNPETRQFAANELRRTLSSNWICHEGRYYVVRGNVRREVPVRIGSLEEEKRKVIVAVEVFFTVLGGMKGLADWGVDEGVDAARREREGLGCGEVFL